METTEEMMEMTGINDRNNGGNDRNDGRNDGGNDGENHLKWPIFEYL